MAGSVIKVLLIALMVCALVAAPALASMPSVHGASYPHTVYLDRGIKGSVSGKVVSSLDQAQGIEGAYVAVVDMNDLNREYANTTTNANGEYTISNLGATYSETKKWGPDGKTETYSQGIKMFMLYVNKSGMSEGYSAPFGIDANHTNTRLDPIPIYAGALEPTPTPEPTVLPTIVVTTPEPTAQPTAVPTITPETVTPAPPAGLTGYAGPILVVALLLVLAAAAAAVYFKFLRNRLVRKIRKK